MTPQLKLVTAGAIAGLVAKFAFGKDNTTSLLFGLAAISTIAVLTAHTDVATSVNPA